MLCRRAPPPYEVVDFILYCRHTKFRIVVIFGDQAREDNKLPTGNNVELGGWNELEVSTSNVPVDTSISSFNPMETFPLSSVIDREYVIHSFEWYSTVQPNVTIATYKLPGNIINSTSAGSYLKEKLNGFKYFRTKFRVGVRVVSNRTMYGRLMVSQTYLPEYDDTWILPGTEPLFTYSGYPHMLVSATSSDTVYMDIPFVYPARYALLSPSYDELVGIKLTVLNPLSSVEEEDINATVIVTAQLVECELMYPIKSVQLQSNEAHVKSAEQVISNSLISNRDTVSTFVSKIPYGKRIMHGYDSATHGFQAMGLEKPNALTLINKFQKGCLNQNTYSKGLETGTVFASTAEAKVSSTVPITSNTNEMDLLTLVQTPTFVGTNALNNITTTPVIVWSDTLPGMDHNFAYYISKAFRWFSTSWKIKVYVSASIFHNARVVFWLSPSTSSVTNDFTQYYHQIFDITGDTEFDFTIPYVASDVMARTKANAGNSNPTSMILSCAVIGWSVPGGLTSTPNIYLNTYCSAGPDFKVSEQLDVAYQFTQIPSVSTVELQSNPREDFKKEFSFFHPSFQHYYHHGFVDPDSVDSIKDLILRKYPLKEITAGTPEPLLTYGDQAFLPNKIFGFEYFMVPYLFYRGAIRATIVPINGSRTVVFLVNSTDGGVVQGYSACGGDVGQIDIEAPYYDDKWFQIYRSERTSLFKVDLQGTPSAFMLTSAGDDFTLGFIRGIRDGTFHYNERYSAFAAWI